MISLVVSTVSRTRELDRLLASLEKQTYKDFEVVIADQNSDGRVSEVLGRYKGLQIRHLHSCPGLSRARNVGFKVASRSVCGIPDDDCWYPPELLGRVSSWFQTHSDFDVLLTSVCDEDGKLLGPGKRSGLGCECNRHNVWHNGVSINAFWRRSVIDDVGTFDEEIGAGCGTRFQSGEETDLYLRALGNGHRLWFEPALCVYHPSPETIRKRISKQTYPYALGTGYLLRKHHYSPYALVKDFLAYPFAGTLVALCKLDICTTRIRLLRMLGMVVGYLSAGPK
ncbi:MAG: glycosyltransferase [Terriglobia bacterium]